MLSELKVYTSTQELILHVRYAPEELFPIQIVDGTPEMQAAMLGLAGHDFERVVIKNRQLYRFAAKWRSQGYIQTLASYWATNYEWRTAVMGVGSDSIYAWGCEQRRTTPTPSVDITGTLNVLRWTGGTVSTIQFCNRINAPAAQLLGSSGEFVDLAASAAQILRAVNAGIVSAPALRFVHNSSSANEFSLGAILSTNDPATKPVLTALH